MSSRKTSRGPERIASVQLQADLRRLGRHPALLERKWKRMTASPFAFLRGASAVWAVLLEREPQLLKGIPGTGVLVGDLHLENVGTFRTARGVSLHVNDFDESFLGPWAFDVARLLTSTLLARPELRVTGLEVVGLLEAVLEGHDAGLAGASPRLSAPLSGLVEAALAREETRFLSKRLAAPHRLVRDEKMPAAPSSKLPLARAAVRQWAEATRQKETVEVLDLTRRVAGTGSLGVERLVALVRVGETERLLELKEVRGSSFGPSAGPVDPLAWLAQWLGCLPSPPLDVAACLLGSLPVLVRPWFASDDKLSVDELDVTALPQTMRAIGVMAGEVHRRGARTKARWTAEHRRRLLDAASHLAGLHEQVFHQFCRDVHEALK